jgi:biotin carboxyl carrier protein
MTFEVEVDGRTFPVSIERMDSPRRFRVTVDGVPQVIDVARPNDFTLALLTRTAAPAVPAGDGGGPEKGTVDGVLTSTDFQIAPGPRPGELLVGLEGRTINVTVNGRRSAHAEAGSHGHGAISIAAPMPGRVVRVLVAAGDEVAARQGVVVVEAMKMENELRAPRAGRVKEVSVAAGTSVEAGRILAVIE